VEIRNSAKGGLSLDACSGRVTNLTIADALDFGLKILDAMGLDISGNTVSGCGNNGILIWRSKNGEDGSTVTNNRISNIRKTPAAPANTATASTFIAGSVLVAQNRISDCTYTAVRGNASSNIQIIANSCERLGEVAIYSECSFEGALIANNLIDFAATGISATNFNEGGRLAVIQGNLIRNMLRREQEPDESVAKASASKPTRSSPATRSKARRVSAFKSAGGRSCAMSPSPAISFAARRSASPSRMRLTSARA
jgi:uncharacterized secreted repeat protein (TIGR03808 family)